MKWRKSNRKLLKDSAPRPLTPPPISDKPYNRPPQSDLIRSVASKTLSHDRSRRRNLGFLIKHLASTSAIALHARVRLNTTQTQIIYLRTPKSAKEDARDRFPWSVATAGTPACPPHLSLPIPSRMFCYPSVTLLYCTDNRPRCALPNPYWPSSLLDFRPSHPKRPRLLARSNLDLDLRRRLSNHETLRHHRPCTRLRLDDANDLD